MEDLVHCFSLVIYYMRSYLRVVRIWGENSGLVLWESRWVTVYCMSYSFFLVEED